MIDAISIGLIRVQLFSCGLLSNATRDISIIVDFIQVLALDRRAPWDHFILDGNDFSKFILSKISCCWGARNG